MLLLTDQAGTTSVGHARLSGAAARAVAAAAIDVDLVLVQARVATTGRRAMPADAAAAHAVGGDQAARIDRTRAARGTAAVDLGLAWAEPLVVARCSHTQQFSANTGLAVGGFAARPALGALFALRTAAIHVALGAVFDLIVAGRLAAPLVGTSEARAVLVVLASFFGWATIRRATFAAVHRRFAAVADAIVAARGGAAACTAHA